MILKSTSSIIITNPKGSKKISKILEPVNIPAQKKEQNRAILRKKFRESGIYDNDF